MENPSDFSANLLLPIFMSRDLQRIFQSTVLSGVYIMTDDYINRLAVRLGIAAERIGQWQSAYKNKRARNRPEGMLSVGDIERKYGIPATKLRIWRNAGLPSERGKGHLVLIKEADLLEWIKRKA